MGGIFFKLFERAWISNNPKDKFQDRESLSQRAISYGYCLLQWNSIGINTQERPH